MCTGNSYEPDTLRFDEGIANLDNIREGKTKAKAESYPLCKQHNTIIIDSKSADIVCSKCGMVVSDELIKSDWQTSSNDSMRAETTVGPPASIARHDMGLSTIIGNENIDACKNQIKPAMLSTMNRSSLGFQSSDK